jgi:aminoglycoside phosphotransferase (APT) family kinase protein
MADDAQQLGRRIIEINRKVRLGDTPIEEWTRRIERMLRAQPDLHGAIRVSRVRALEGGAGSSSGTLFFQAEVGAENSAKEYVLRFTPAEQLFHSYDLDGQVRIQRALAETDVPVPAQCWEDIKGAYLTVPGYIMERARGDAAPGAWFSEGIIAEASPAHRRELILSFVATLARIHAVDWRRRGLSFLLDRARGEGLIAREINWYWDGIAWAVETGPMERFQGIRAWLLENQPAYQAPVLCHGDANFTNYLFAGNGVSAVLDWEMAFIGTPECDLSYAVLGMAALTGQFPEGVPSAEEMLAEYERLSGRSLQNMPYYRLFSLYRIVLIHCLGLRAFPPDFQAAFQGYVDSLIAKLMAQARSVGAA